MHNVPFYDLTNARDRASHAESFSDTPGSWTPLFNFQKRDLLIFFMIEWWFGLDSQVMFFLDYMSKKQHIMYKNMICPIKSWAFGHEKLFKNTPGASKYHKRLLFGQNTFLHFLDFQ